jgi:excisionase family DNA binding protein
LEPGKENGMSRISQGKTKAGGIPDFFTVADLARRWQVSTRHVHRIKDSGQLPFIQLGRNIRFAAAEVLLFEARCGSVT